MSLSKTFYLKCLIVHVVDPGIGFDMTASAGRLLLQVDSAFKESGQGLHCLPILFDSFLNLESL